MSENNLKKDTENTFSEVMQALVWRYISLKHRQSDINTISEDHIQEIKSDISALKYQLWDILKENGMQIVTDSKKDKGTMSGNHYSIAKKIIFKEKFISSTEQEVTRLGKTTDERFSRRNGRQRR